MQENHFHVVPIFLYILIGLQDQSHCLTDLPHDHHGIAHARSDRSIFSSGQVSPAIHDLPSPADGFRPLLRPLPRYLSSGPPPAGALDLDHLTGKICCSVIVPAILSFLYLSTVL